MAGFYEVMAEYEDHGCAIRVNIAQIAYVVPETSHYTRLIMANGDKIQIRNNEFEGRTLLRNIEDTASRSDVFVPIDGL